MVILCVLRALADLGVYYAFAGTLACVFGGERTLPALLLLSGCYALSSALRKRKWARLLALAPGLLCFLLPGVSAADRVACLFPLVYCIYLAWTGEYSLNWGRQADVFSLFWKAFAVFAILMAAIGCGNAVLSVGLPVAILTAAASVLLLRTLRHAPEVYLQRAFQMYNFAAVALLLAAACLIGSRWLLRGAAALVKLAYDHVLAPLLLGLFTVIGRLCIAVMPESVEVFGRLLENISDWFGPAESVEPGAGAVGDAAAAGLTQRVFTALAILAVLVVLCLLFRWLVRRRAEETAGLPDTEARTERAAPVRQATPRTSTAVHRIRSQYRSFLKLCRQQGIVLTESDTSEEISRKAAARFPEQEALTELCSLYQKARYHLEATQEDAAQAKRLCARLKRSLRDS